MVQEHGLQQLRRDQGRSLQELAELVNLDAFIHIIQPLPGLLDRLLGRLVDTGF